MNSAAHQIASRIIDQAMPGDGIFASKGGCHNIKFVMPAVPGTGVAGMAMRFVFDGDA